MHRTFSPSPATPPWLRSFAGLTVLVAICGSTALAAGLGVTPPDQFRVQEGFEVELIYEVPGPSEGSWVSLTVDPEGRLIACDQAGGLFRIDVSEKPAKVEKLSVDLSGAQGLLCAFGSLYANVNQRGEPCGLWRLTDTDSDDQYDKKEHLVPLNGGSEHGPHGIVLSPDGDRLIFVAGNNTNLPKQIDHYRVPPVWQEDHLLGRMPDARGHNANRLAPGGFILSLAPDGSDVELVATGFRNPYDIALNRDGELFTYDADMEWDVGTPWYRPTRINHVISGGEYGWRNGTGKWPAYYPDSFGAAVDIGPGSPTGICFGYGAAFPEKFQNALFVADWSYGNIHAVFLEPDGASYTGSYQTFATAAPLPVTDMVIHPDGAMYFTIGGRGTQSALYRIRYVGGPDSDVAAQATESEEALVQEEEVVQEFVADEKTSKAMARRGLRFYLERMHRSDESLLADESLDGLSVAEAAAVAIDHLGSRDPAIRYAARVALEHRDLSAWRAAVLEGDTDSPHQIILGVLALARVGEKELQSACVDRLASIEMDNLTADQKVDWLRTAGLVAMRLGDLTDVQRQTLRDQLSDEFPSGDDILDRELAIMLIYLRDADATAKIVARMQSAPSQESQIHYAMALRNVTDGWTPESREAYFQWFNDIQSARGGMSFGGFIDNIRKAAIKNLSPELKSKLADVLEPQAVGDGTTQEESRPLVKQWTVEELVDFVSTSDRHPDFERGKAMFAAAQCYKCHRMGVQGGILGPDLTSAGGKFNVRDMLTSIIEPSKVISDQYGATQFLTDRGDLVTGRVINMNRGKLSVMTNMLDPSSLKSLQRDEILETRPAKVSMMPSGLVDVLTAKEIADLVAYLRAGGRSDHPIYDKRSSTN